MDLSPTWGRKRTWRRKKGRALEEKGMALGKRAWRWEKGAWRGAMLKGAGGNTMYVCLASDKHKVEGKLV